MSSATLPSPRRLVRPLWVSALTAALAFAAGKAASQGPPDNRQEWFEAQGEADLMRFARADALLVWRFQLTPSASGYTMPTIPWNTFQANNQSFPLCSTTRFFGQPWTGVGSAILVGDRHVLTAEHLVPSALPCDQTAFVFDYLMKEPNDPVPGDLSVPADHVYFCESVVAHGSDWAVVQLDRPVSIDRMPLKVRRGDVVSAGSAQVNVGHPQRIPMKLQVLPTAADLGISSIFISGFRVAPGSSGSMLVDRTGGKVTGITVAGGGYGATGPSGCFTDCATPGCAGALFTNVLAGASAVIPRIGLQVSPEFFGVTEHGLPGEGPLPEPLTRYTVYVPKGDRRAVTFRATLTQIGPAGGPRFLLNGGTAPVTGVVPVGAPFFLDITHDGSAPMPKEGITTVLTVVDETYLATDVRKDHWTVVGGD